MSAAEAGEAETKEARRGSVWDVYWPRRVHQDQDAVVVASFPMILYFWPTMIAFLVIGVIQSVFGGDPQTLGIWAIAIWAANLMVIVTDLDQKKFVILVLLLALLGLGLWISSLKGWGIGSAIAGWIDGLSVTLSSQAYFLISSVLWFLFAAGMLNPRLNYWRLEPNEFVHYVQPFGRDQSIPRQGSTVTREVPDVLEMLLTFGGGTLVVRREGQIVARIEHVPFLGRRMIAIERLLSSTRVHTVSD